MKRYYFDTSIWLDFFEDRNEPQLAKGRIAHELISKIVIHKDQIVYSDNNLLELHRIGYTVFEIEHLFENLQMFLEYVEATKKQIGKARDLAHKRNIPKRDALHALIARDNRAIMVTYDKHFKELRDITEPMAPTSLI